MRRLVGIPWTQPELRNLDKTVRLWLTWARTLTGWDSPAFRPNVKCPACGMRGSLRVRLDRGTACCVEPNCYATWDQDTIGILAQIIRTANGEALV
jgi:hypothetical protein